MSTQTIATIIDEWQTVAPPPPPAIVPVRVDPAKTALLLLDFLGRVCTLETRPRAAAVLPRLQAFLHEARRRRMTVVHTTTRNGAPDGSDLAEALKPIAGERVYSAKFDKFHGNDLETYLAGRGIDTVIATGTSANGCLLGTTAGALLRGFRAIVPIDGMPAATPYQEQFVAWQIANGPSFKDQAVLTRLDAISFQGAKT
jgi:nicotinamidase-related amidase